MAHAVHMTVQAATTGRAAPASPQDLADALRATGYLPDEGLATVAWLAMRLRRPLLLEGEPGTGKTALAEALAESTGATLVRMQCYEGIDASQALYDWDVTRQVLHLRALEATRTAGSPVDVQTAERSLFDERFLLERPVLRALRTSPSVLLVDEIDRADDEFEAFLLEVLSTWSVTIPELGTVTAQMPPLVVLTSNRTREVHDALKRRCLYHWVEHPSLAREIEIVRTRLPDVPLALAEQVPPPRSGCATYGLLKPPGVAETLDWARCLVSSAPATSTPRRGHHPRRRAEVPRGRQPRAARPRPAAGRLSGARGHGRRHDHPPGAPAGEILLLLGGFARAVRAAGVPVTPDRTPSFLTAAAEVGVTDRRASTGPAGRRCAATPTTSRRYDLAFAAWFEGKRPAAGQPLPRARTSPVADLSDAGRGGVEERARTRRRRTPGRRQRPRCCATATSPTLDAPPAGPDRALFAALACGCRAAVPRRRPCAPGRAGRAPHPARGAAPRRRAGAAAAPAARARKPRRVVLLRRRVRLDDAVRRRAAAAGARQRALRRGATALAGGGVHRWAPG